MTESGLAADGLPVIERGLSFAPTSHWGNKILFDALLAVGEVEQAYKRYGAFIDTHNDIESAKDWYVERTAELGLLDVAAAMNEKRSVIKDIPRRSRFALGIQCFAKVDTLEKVFSSILNLDNSEDVSLVILQDSLNNTSQSDRYAEGHKKVENLISKYVGALQEKFFSVECLRNKTNLGTAPTCRRLIDHICDGYDGFLFIEDDCVLSPSALDWTRFNLANTVSVEGPWFVTCESSFFDKEHRLLDKVTKARLEAIANLNSIKNAFMLSDFVNSTCFSTTSEIWKICASYRSFTRGPESLTRFVRTKGMKTISPIVPRCADIGMLHELGYSVARMGLENVRERKETFIMPDEPFNGEFCAPYDGDLELLHLATSQLDQIALERLEEIGFAI